MYCALKDAKSVDWKAGLDYTKCLVTLCNTILGEHYWLRLPIGLSVSHYVFQKRLDQVMRLIPGVIGISDDMQANGKVR